MFMRIESTRRQHEQLSLRLRQVLARERMQGLFVAVFVLAWRGWGTKKTKKKKKRERERESSFPRGKPWLPLFGSTDLQGISRKFNMVVLRSLAFDYFEY